MRDQAAAQACTYAHPQVPLRCACRCACWLASCSAPPLRRCLHAWRVAAEELARQRLLRELQQGQLAAACYEAALLRRALQGWAAAAPLQRLQREAEAQRAATWTKIDGWLQELAPQQRRQAPEGRQQAAWARGSGQGAHQAAAGEAELQAGPSFDDELDRVLRGSAAGPAAGEGGPRPRDRPSTLLAKDRLLDLGWLEEAEAELAQVFGL